MKDEALRRVLVPLRIKDMGVEVARYAGWYNESHSSLHGATPAEALRGERPAIRKPRLEPQARFPARGTTDSRTRQAQRSAARYVFRKHPDVVRMVTSQYERRKRLDARSLPPAPRSGPLAPAAHPHHS